MRRRYILVLLGCALSCACSRLQQVRSEDKNDMRTINHPNGMSVRYDGDKFSVRQIDNGFEFLDSNAAYVRSPSSVEVKLEPGSEPSGQWPKTKDVDGHRVHYRIEMKPGGSSGDAYTLIGWTNCSASHYLSIRQKVEAETAEAADFSSAWALLGATTCPR